ncbi:MAG: hypothetical protein EA363_04410 [Balneolaceae bacterium]|nr:MAG: hypothetical protein EA363_04410 [Balneolaceae bacterium]
MNRKRTEQQLREQLIDAQDGNLSRQEMEQLKKQVLAFDPKLWEDHQWMMRQSGDGIPGLFEGLREEAPAGDAIRRFHQRREATGGSESDLEYLVWRLFRRYVLSVGIVLIVLFTGMQMGSTEDAAADSREQMTRYLGWEQQQAPELNHWLYEDL